MRSYLEYHKGADVGGGYSSIQAHEKLAKVADDFASLKGRSDTITFTAVNMRALRDEELARPIPDITNS